MLLSRRALPAHLRTPWRAGFPSRLQRRWFQPRHCRTVLLERSEHMTEETILGAFPQTFAKIESQVPLIVVLSTPSLSTRLFSPSGPTSTLQTLVAKVLGRSLKHQFGTTISAIRVVSAVVDALPAPTTGQTAEGISYMVLAPDRVEQDLVIAPDEADRDELGTLEFSFSDKWHQETRSNVKVPWGETDYRVAIKLANTLFLSGRKKTLLDANYLVNPSGDLHLTQYEWLAHCSIPYHAGENCFLANFDERVLKSDKFLNLSLIPLTEPRKISVSLGNILRTVELPDGSQCPASHELEANLESYFRATDQQPHPRPVWALLTGESGVERSRMVFHNAKFIDALHGDPSQRSGLEIIWSKPDLEASAEYQIPLREAILLEGAKLQRVLSGGGGWGDKAGLLALDPHDLIPTRRSNEEEISQFSSDNSDYTHVQFFTSANSPPPQLFQYRQGFYMGVVPDGTPKWMPPMRSREIDIYSNSFAALSYGGMNFRTNTSINEANFPTLQEHPMETTRTKVDVPFASFTYLLASTYAKLDRTRIRPVELLEMGRSNLATGHKLLRHLCEALWVVLRDTSIALQRDARVNLRTRRDQIKPLLDSLIQIITVVNPSGLGYLSQGIRRLNAMADTSHKEHQRRKIGNIHKQIRSTGALIDRVATRICQYIRRTQDDAKWMHEFDVRARQRSIAPVYADLIRIVGNSNPQLLDNYRNALRRTMSVIIGYRLLYYHNEFMKARSFVRKTREQIDDSKRALGVPITHYKGTTGAGAEIVASELRNMLGAESEGQSEQNLSEIKHPRGAKQGLKKSEQESQ